MHMFSPTENNTDCRQACWTPKIELKQHSPLIGWAADGFPIYAVYGYSDPNDSKSKVQKLSSSYQLKTGSRPGGDAPAGIYDGTFVRDYEYVPESGDLDECNGCQTVTPEFPNGTYAYFLTEQWPVIPRFWKGTPSQDFQRGRAGGGQLFPRGLGEQSAGRSPMGQRPTGPNGFGGSRDFGAPGSREPNGNQPFGAPPKPGQILPDFVKRSLNLTEDQQQQIDKLSRFQSMNSSEKSSLRNKFVASRMVLDFDHRETHHASNFPSHLINQTEHDHARNHHPKCDVKHIDKPGENLPKGNLWLF